MLRKSKDISIKSPNLLNRIKLYIEPLNNKTVSLLETGKINDLQSKQERAKILKKEAGWDAKEAKHVVDIYQGSILVNGAAELQRFDRVRSYLSAAFRDWVGNCIIAKEPATGIKVVFTDMTIHEDPRHTQYGQIAGMVFSALTLAMRDAFNNTQK